MCDDGNVSAPGLDELLSDLEAEQVDLDRIVSTPGVDWKRPTPAPGWTVADQISHLAFFDERAALALTDPDAFSRDTEQLMAARRDVSVDRGRTLSGTDLTLAWRHSQRHLLEAARRADPTRRVPWYGPAMSVRSCLTARLMETWAHGQDVVDALGLERVGTDRLRNVAHIAVGARAYALSINGRPSDDRPVRVELTAPSGATWEWGPVDATGGRVCGAALDFCLVAVQRRHRDDVVLEIEGDGAEAWMEVAQAFAGPPGRGRTASG